MSAAVCFLTLTLLYVGVSVVQAVRYLHSLVAGAPPDGSVFQSGILMTAVSYVWFSLLALCLPGALRALFVVGLAGFTHSAWLFRVQVRREGNA